jgi:hypothetical protein
VEATAGARRGRALGNPPTISTSPENLIPTISTASGVGQPGSQQPAQRRAAGRVGRAGSRPGVPDIAIPVLERSLSPGSVSCLQLYTRTRTECASVHVCHVARVTTNDQQCCKTVGVASARVPRPPTRNTSLDLTIRKGQSFGCLPAPSLRVSPRRVLQLHTPRGLPQ